ncbi:MAG: hypothetical protein ACM35H_00070 [Bacteroidota bacterium]|nr:hypothetical protein [Kiloniellaceae bacterium]
MRLLNGVLGMALLGLAACAELGIQLPDLRGPATAPAAPVAAEQALSNAGRFPEDVTQEAAKPLPPLPVRKPPVPADVLEAAPAPEVDPDALVGLDFERASALLGAPAMLIDEPPAKIWAYNGTNCVLHVFFYPKVGGSDFRVLTYEVKGGPEGSATRAGEPARTAEAKAFAQSCLNELLTQAEAGRAGGAQPSAQPADGAAGGS